ncbi:MAG TPA: phosphatase PAP2 family protein, partial [Pseudonocardia sp.]|nr:phosphatase PAP2 family protein [Pseudonocardia sp.]
MAAEQGDPQEGGPGGRAGSAHSHPAGLDHPLGAPPVRRSRALVLVLGLAIAAAAAVATAFFGAGPARVDRAVLGEVIDTRTEPLTALAVFVTNAGSTAAMGVVAALAALLLFRARRPYDAIFIGATAAGASLLFTGLKRLLDRARPPEPDQLVGAANESLPSGHATMSAAVIGSLVVLAWTGRSVVARVAMVVAAAAWVGAVGLTRIYLGVHW